MFFFFEVSKFLISKLKKIIVSHLKFSLCTFERPFLLISRIISSDIGIFISIFIVFSD